MRNLKRMLCLVLSVVMLVGMMMIGAGAAGIDDFGDVAEINPARKDAVALLTELGVIQGGNDGNFYPKDGYTRAAMAKIAYLLNNKQTDYTTWVGMIDGKDAKGHWSEGAMVWCNTWRNQIITGGNDANFYPDDALTVVQCAVMMLRSLGYNNDLEGFTGTGWEVRTIYKAKEIGLLDGLENLKADQRISREDACQMAYNALFIPTVYHLEKWDNEKKMMVPTGYETLPVTGVGGAVTGSTEEHSPLIASTFAVETKEKVQITRVDAAGKAYMMVNGAETVINGLKATPDMVGATVNYYEKNGKAIAATVTSSVVATLKGSADYTAKVGAGKAYELSVDSAEGVTPVTTAAVYYINGVKRADPLPGELKAGSVIELINNNADSKIEVVRITNKTVAQLEADPVITTKNDVTTVTIKGTDITNANVNTVKGYEDLKEDDVVLIAKVAGITTIEKADTFVGKVDGIHSTKGALIGGSYFKASDLGGNYNQSKCNDGKEWNFYLDNNGNIAYAVAVSTGDQPTTEKETGYLVVNEVTWVKNVETGSFDDELSGRIDAKVVFFDGTKATVTIDSVDGIKSAPVGAKLSSLGKYYAKDSTGHFTTDTKATAHSTTKANVTTATDSTNTDQVVAAGKYYVMGTKSGDVQGQSLTIYYGVDTKANLTGTDAKPLFGIANDLAGTVFAYTKNKDGHYSITNLSKCEDVQGDSITNAEVKSGKTAFVTNQIANSKTVFLYEIKDSDNNLTYKTYTGFENIPGVGSGANGTIVESKTTGVASHVFVQAAKAQVSDPTGAAKGDLMYVLSTTDYTTIGSGKDAYIQTTQLLNGVETEMKLAAGSMSKLTAGNVYDVTEKDGIWTVGSAKTATTGIKANDGGVLVDNNGNVYTYADGTPAYVIDLDGAITETTVDQLAKDGNDEVIIDHNSNEVNVIYVNKVTSEPTAPAFVTVVDGTATISVTPAAGTTVKDVTIDGNAMTQKTGSVGTFTYSAANLTATATVVITVEDNNSGEEEPFAYSVQVISDTAEEKVKVSLNSVAVTAKAVKSADNSYTAEEKVKVADTGMHFVSGAMISLVDKTGREIFNLSDTNAYPDTVELAIVKIVLPNDMATGYDWKIAFAATDNGTTMTPTEGTSGPDESDPNVMYIIVSNKTKSFELFADHQTDSTKDAYFYFSLPGWTISE